MPNHVANEIILKRGHKVNPFTRSISPNSLVSIEDFKRDATDFMESNFPDNEEIRRNFDFNKIIQMPDFIFKGNIGAEEQAKYQNRNWYEWSIENWGTKWNAYDTFKYGEANIDKITEENINEENNQISFTFNTAWSAPLPVYKQMSFLYPHILFDIHFADEDYGSNVGHLTLEAGELITVSYPEPFSDEAYTLAKYLLGSYDEEDEDE